MKNWGFKRKGVESEVEQDARKRSCLGKAEGRGGEGPNARGRVGEGASRPKLHLKEVYITRNCQDTLGEK